MHKLWLHDTLLFYIRTLFRQMCFIQSDRILESKPQSNFKRRNLDTCRNIVSLLEINLIFVTKPMKFLMACLICQHIWLHIREFLCDV